jgi:CubicO group peptidase (beta-lactamase class C family)
MEQEMETFLQAHLETGEFMGSVLVARGDEILYSSGFGMANLEHNVPNTPETIFRLASLTKQFTAAAILQLQEKGLLDINDPVDRYLPEYPGGDEITIHQLLNHTSGLPDYEHLESTMAYRNAVSLDELMAKFSGLPLDFQPGSQFNYSNSGYVVLTAIIEKVSGQSYAEYLDEHIFQPLGMGATRFDNADTVLPGRAAGYTWDGSAYHNAEFFDMSNVAGAGGLVSTVGDLYKWDRALYGDVVLSESSRQAFFSPTFTFDEDAGYTYGGAMLEISGRSSILFNGQISGFFTTALRYPDEELYVVVLGNLESPSVQAVALGLAAIALGDPYQIPGGRTAIDLDPAISEKYAGSYQLAPDTVVTITSEAGRLFIEAPDMPKFEIFPESETEFFAQVSGTEILLHFQVDGESTVTGMIVQQGDQEAHAEKID